MPILPDAADLNKYNISPSRGQPSYRASPVGGALQGLGQTIGALGGTLSAEQERQKAELDKTEAFGVQSRLTAFETNWSKQLEERQANVTPGAAGFSDKLTADYTQSAREFMGTVPESLRPQIDVRLGNILQSFAPDAQNFQRKEAFRYGQEKVTDGLNTMLTRLARTPDKWPDIQKEGEDLIRSNPAYTPVQQEEAIRAWTEERRIANIKMDAEINGPAAVKDKLGVTPGGNLPSGSFHERLVQVESGGNPNASPSTSQAKGLGQFIPSTWREFIADRHPDLLANGEDIQKYRTDIALGNEAIDWYAGKNAAYLKDKGLPATDGTLYLAHFAGPAGAAALLNADPSASAVSVLGQSVITANPQLRGMTASEVISWAEKKIGGVKGAATPVNPDYAALDYNKRVDIYDKLVVQDRKDFAAKVDDYSAFLRNGGEVPSVGGAPGLETGTDRGGVQTAPSGETQQISATGTAQGEFSLPEMQRRLGPDVGQEAYDQLRQDAAFGTTMNEIKMAPPERVATILSQAQEALSTPTDFKDKAVVYAGVTAAIDARKKAIEADPAGYVIKNDPQVAQAWQNVEPGGQGYAVALKKTADAQTAIGVPQDQMALLPKPIATQAVTRFKNVDLPEEQRLTSLTSTVFGTPSRDHQQAVFQQLVKAGIPEMTEGALDALARKDEGAARRLFEAAMVDPAKIGRVNVSPEKIHEQIQTDIMDEGKIGDVAYGLTFGDPSNYERAARDTELMTRSVQLRMLNGSTIDAAIDGAKKDLFGDRQVIQYDGDIRASLLLPMNTDATPLPSGLNAVLPQFRFAVEAAAMGIDRSKIPSSDASRAIVDAAMQNTVDRIMTAGVFRNVAGGVGLFDPYSGGFVVGTDGKPLTVSVEEVLRLGKMSAPVVPAGSDVMSLPASGLGGIDPTSGY